MNLRRLALFYLVPLLPVLAAELISYKWMNPTIEKAYIYPTLAQPFADRTFKSDPERFDKIKSMLQCNQGWLGTIGSESSVITQLAWVEWSHTATGNTFEAYHHKPEDCMGSSGMKLERSYPKRVYGSGDKQFVFESLLFQPLRGGPAIHVFKAIWVSGLVGADARKNIFEDTANTDLRALRFATATHRFRPEQARVLMAGVIGLPSEELAWKSFSREILPQIQWTTVQPSATY